MQAGVSPGSDMQGLPTVVSANGPFFYELDDLFRLMPPSTVEMLSLMLSDDCPMSDWKMVADRLGNSSQDIEMFSLQARHPPNFLPCSRMLIKWSKRDGSTIRVLKQTFEEIGRTDAASLLEEERKRKFRPTVVLKAYRGNDSVATPALEVSGRLSLQEALIPVLEDHASRYAKDCSSSGVTFFNIVSGNKTWKTEVHEFQGQQINITWEQRYQRPMTWIQKLGVRSFLVTDEVIATLNSSSSCTAHFESRSENQSNEDVSETRQTLTTTEQQRDDDKNSNTRPVSVPQQESCSSSHHEKEEDTEVKAGSPKVPLISLHSELGAPTAACAEAGAGDRVPDDARHVSSVVSDKVTEQRPSPMQPQRIVNELAHIPGYHSMVGNLKSQIKRVMGRRSRHGQYIIRSFDDKVTGHLSIALSVKYKDCNRETSIKHYRVNILSTATVSGSIELRFYLFVDDFVAPSMRQLLQHYTEHPLDGQSFVLTEPITVRDHDIFDATSDIEAACGIN